MTRMTKPQLVDENIRLRELRDVLERRVRELTEQLAAASAAPQAQAAAQPEPQAPSTSYQGAVPHATYYEYVAAKRAYARARGSRVASYLSRTDWEARVAAHRAQA